MRIFSAFIPVAVLAFLFTRVAFASDPGGLLLVANKGDNALGIIDPSTGRQIAEIPEGGVTGHELVSSEDGRLVYVPIYGNSGVGQPGTDGSKMVVIDVKARKVVGSMDFGKGVRPHLPVLGPKDGLLYVSTELQNAITIIDPATLKIVGTVPTGQAQSHMFAVTRDGRRAYTANVGPGTVSVLDLEARKMLAIIPVSPQIQRISLSADDKLAFTSDVTKPRLAVIDLASNKVKTWIPMPGLGYGSAATPDGKWLVIALPLVNQVVVIDLQTMRVAHTVTVPSRPQEVLISPGGKTAYVSCDQSGKIAVIDTANWTVQRLIDAGKNADGLAWASAR